MNLILAPQVQGIDSFNRVVQSKIYQYIDDLISKLKFSTIPEDYIMHMKYGLKSYTCFKESDIKTIRRFKYEIYDGYSNEIEKSTRINVDLSSADRTTKVIDEMTDKEYTSYIQRVLDKKIDLGIREIIKSADTLVYLSIPKKGYEIIKLTYKDYKICKAVAFIDLSNFIDRYYIEGEDVEKEEFYEYASSGF